MKNRIYFRMQGFLEEQEVHEAAERVISEVNKMPGKFDFINDISQFKPASLSASREIERCVKYTAEHGLRHVIRILGPNVISKMQFDRVSKTVGSASITEEVATIEEAEQRLDELTSPIDQKISKKS